MFRIVVLFFVSIFNIVMQSTVLNVIELNNVIPNTALILVVSYGVLRNDTEAACFGIWIGLLHDIFLGRIIGLYALGYFFVGLVSGRSFKGFYRENILSPLIVVAVATFFFEIYIFLFTYLFRASTDISYYMTNLIIPEMIYNVIVTLPIYASFYVINKVIENIEKPKRKIF